MQYLRKLRYIFQNLEYQFLSQSNIHGEKIDITQVPLLSATRRLPRGRLFSFPNIKSPQCRGGVHCYTASESLYINIGK
jgi:hypothetical protein